ncbi:MAG: DUF2130 domain-containing protein [Gammaproteobacteria bacterium]
MASTESSILHARTHLQVTEERCPWCNQPITHDKFEEIQARIKREERERAAQVEKRLKAEYEAALKFKDAERARAVQAAVEAEKKAAADRETTNRAEATKQAQAQFNQRLVDANARAKAAQEAKAAAEQQVKELTATQEAAINKRMQHELAKAKEAYEKRETEKTNQVRAEEFANHQKLQTRVDELQRELNKKTSNELGEGAEVVLFDALRDAYPGDRIERIKKGELGADIRHDVMHDGQLCGRILYDSKARKKWEDNYAAKLREDQIAAKAEHAVLSALKFPGGKQQLCEKAGVIVTNPARVVDLVQLLRRDVIRSRRLRLSNEDRAAKTAKLYDLLTSERFVQKLARVDELAGELLELDKKEMEQHNRVWEARGKRERAIQKANADLRIEIDSILEG